MVVEENGGGVEDDEAAGRFGGGGREVGTQSVQGVPPVLIYEYYT